jgi:hypothetical protein
LAVVRYAPDHSVFEEWVYNAADIDDSKVIWARDWDAASNVELMGYYRDRKVWLIEPDANPAKITPYTGTTQNVAHANLSGITATEK